MGLFGIDAKFVKLVAVIDERLSLYELLAQGDPEKVPPGIKTLVQEFRNLKVRAWSIEKNNNDAAKYVRDMHEEDIRKMIKKDGDVQ